MTPGDEGTPLVGPLPLELQQIKAEKEAAAARAGKIKAAAAQAGKIKAAAAKLVKKVEAAARDVEKDAVQDVVSRRSEETVMKKRTGKPFRMMTPYDASEVSRPNKRKTFTAHISAQLPPEVRWSKASTKCVAMKNLGRWKATDDLSLITGVGQTRDIVSVFRSVKFSCHFTLAELEERWHALLYDKVISRLAIEAVRLLPQEVVHRVTMATPFSRTEEDAIAAMDMANCAQLLSTRPEVFHPARTDRAVMAHWQDMKQSRLLPGQAVHTQPVCTQWGEEEEQVEDSQLMDPPDLMLNSEMDIVDRIAKRKIKRLEEEVRKWEIIVGEVTGHPAPDFDNQTLAVLRGRLVRYLMRSKEVTVGRAAPDSSVDVDLALEGPASKISRKQAAIRLTNLGTFYLVNLGVRPVLVNGKVIISGEQGRLANNFVVEFSNLKFVFLINTELIEAIMRETAKNQFETCMHGL